MFAWDKKKTMPKPLKVLTWDVVTGMEFDLTHLYAILLCYSKLEKLFFFFKVFLYFLFHFVPTWVLGWNVKECLNNNNDIKQQKRTVTF